MSMYAVFGKRGNFHFMIYKGFPIHSQRATNLLEIIRKKEACQAWLFHSIDSYTILAGGGGGGIEADQFIAELALKLSKNIVW